MGRDNLSSKISSDIACCSDLLETLFSLGPTEVIVFYSLDEGQWKSVNEISQLTGRESSTVYRSLQKLINCGLVVRDTRIIPEGGYYYVYSLLPIDKMADMVRARIESLKSGMEKLLNDLISELSSRRKFFQNE